MSRLAFAPVVLALAASCGDHHGSTPPTPTHEVRTEPIDAGPAGSPPAAVVRKRGVPHFAMITTTAVSRGGEVALSRDQLGDLRLWTALDGSAAPIGIRLPGVSTMRVQVGPGGILMGFTDDGGSGTLIRYSRDGERTGVASISSDSMTVSAVVPLADASGALVVRADQSIELVDPDGTSRARLAMRGTRVRAVEATDGGAVALVKAEIDGRAAHQLVWLGVKDGALTRGDTVDLPRVPADPAIVAIAPGGARVAYFYDPTVPAPLPATPSSGAGAPAGPRKPKPSGANQGAVAFAPQPPQVQRPPLNVMVADAATGKDVTPKELASLVVSDATTLGFTAADRLHVFSTVTDWTVTLGAPASVVAGSTGRNAAPATAKDLVVAGYDRYLLTSVPAGDVRYLGYQVNYPAAAGLSDDGARIAWVAADGHVIVETIDGSAPEIAGPVIDGGASMIRFVGDRAVLAIANRGVATLIDATTGKEIASMPVSGTPQQMAYDPVRRWLAGPRPGGGAWVVSIDASGSGLERVAVVPDGAVMVGFLDGDGDTAPVLYTMDGAQKVRTYSARDLAKVTPEMVAQMPGDSAVAPVFAIDRKGMRYTVNGRKIEIRNRGELVNTIVTEIDPRMLAVSPDGETIVAFDFVRAAHAYDKIGNHLWSVAMGSTAAQGWAYSADGKRFVLIAQDGGTIVDTATGDVVSTGCAWQFGSFANPPPGFALGVSPVCR